MLVLVAGAGHKCVLVERQQLIIVVPVVMVHVLVLQILRGQVLDRFSGLVVVMDVLDHGVGVLVMAHLHRDMDFDVLLPNSEMQERINRNVQLRGNISFQNLADNPYISASDPQTTAQMTSTSN